MVDNILKGCEYFSYCTTWRDNLAFCRTKYSWSLVNALPRRATWKEWSFSKVQSKTTAQTLTCSFSSTSSVTIRFFEHVLNSFFLRSCFSNQALVPNWWRSLTCTITAINFFESVLGLIMSGIFTLIFWSISSSGYLTTDEAYNFTAPIFKFNSILWTDSTLFGFGTIVANFVWLAGKIYFQIEITSSGKFFFG